MFKKNIYIISCVFLIQMCFGQKTSISGKIIDEHLEILPNVILKINDSITTMANLDGEFKIELDRKVRKITFMFVGMEKTTILLDSKCTKLEIVMLFAVVDCFASPRKNERIRKKRFLKIPSLYKEAYEKGIFESDKPCGKIQFISWLPKKEKSN